MKNYDFVIIGSGVAGMKAAFQLRELNPDSSIALITNESTLPYRKPPLSKEFLQVEYEEDKIFLTSTDELTSHRIEYFSGVTVHAIDLPAKLLRISNHSDVGFGKLLICSGGHPFIPQVFTEYQDQILQLRSLDDARLLKQKMSPGKTIAIVGGGFIAAELAASLSKDITIHIFERGDRLLGALQNPLISEKVSNYLHSKNVIIHLNSEIRHVTFNIDKKMLNHDTEVVFDELVIATGIRPNVDFLPDEILMNRPGIPVDIYMQSAVEDVYAAGDVALIPWRKFPAKKYEHWGVAEYSGLLAAYNMSGQNMAFDFIPYAWSDIGEIHIDAGGWLENPDKIIHRRSSEMNRLVSFYLNNNILTGYCCLNEKSATIGVMQKMIRKQYNLREYLKQLGDPTVPLKKILQKL